VTRGLVISAGLAPLVAGAAVVGLAALAADGPERATPSGSADLTRLRAAPAPGAHAYAEPAGVDVDVELPADDARIRELAGAVDDLFEAGRRNAAEELIAAEPAVYGWQDSRAVAAIACAYDGTGMALTVTRRPGVEGPFAVAFAPGTYGAPELNRPRRSQDLMLLRAPTVVVDAGASSGTTRVPVCCGSYELATPYFDQPFALRQAERGSDVDRLLEVLCMGGEPAPEAEAQLAMWTLRNQIAYGRFEERYVTFERSRPIRRHHAGGAARLLLRGGIDVQAVPYYGGWEASDLPAVDGPSPASVAPRAVEEAAPASESAPEREAAPLPAGVSS